MTDEQIIELAKQLGFQRMRIDHDYYVCFSKEIVEFAKLVAQHEREACAKLCDKLEQQVCNMWHGQACAGCAVTIRARGENV